MPNIRLIPNSGSKPTTSQVGLGDIVINTYDGKAYTKKQVGINQSIVEIGAGGASTSASYATTASYALTASYLQGSVTSASYATTASYALTSSYSKNLIISGSINNVDYIDFNTGSAVPAWKSGRVFWDNTDGALSVYNAEQDITLQVGQENWTRVSNRTGTTITDGTVVRLIGAHGDVPEVERAQSLLVSGSVNVLNQILGVATHDIEHNSKGFVTTQGLVKGLNTSAFNDGDTLFVGTGSTGALTNIAPPAPYEIIPVGVCVKASPGGSGIIYVAVQEPIDFSDLSSVLVTGSYNIGDIWTYTRSGSTGVWTHTNQLSGSYGLTGSLGVTQATTSSYIAFNDSSNYLGVSNDIRNWYLTGNSLLVTSEETSPQGLFFKPDGTRFYILGTSGDRVRAYDMSPPWDITTAIIAESFTTSPETAPTDVFIKPDGNVLYIVGTDTDLIRQFNLSTPWVLTGATAAGTLNVTSQDTAPNGIYFKPDGTKMYMVGTTNDRVYEYNLGTAWNITTATFLQFFSVATQESVPVAISFNNDGTRMYILGQTGDDITEYRLSTPWDISTAVFFTTGFTFIQEGTPGGLYYNEDVQRAYIVGGGSDTIYELGTSKQLKLYGDSVVADGQMFVGGRLETAQNIYSNGSITTTSTITAASSLIALNIRTSAADAILGITNLTSSVGATTATSVHRFAHGASTSGTVKTVELGTNGLSTTNIAIHSPFSSGSINIYNPVSFSDSAVITGGLQVKNKLITISQSASDTIVFSDTFTEATNTLLNSHTPNTGSGWTRVQISTFTTPTFTVGAGAGTVGPTTTVNNEGVIYVTNNTFVNPNYEVTATFTAQQSSDDVFWLIARYQDSDNFYGLKWSTSAANCGLYKKTGGVWVLLSALIVSPVVATPASISLRVHDNNITVTNNNVIIIGVLDDSITLPGKAGMAAGNIGQLSTDDFSNVWKVTDFKVQNYDIQYVNSYIEKGSLGVGTTTPSTTLDISGSGRFTGNLTVTGSALINNSLTVGNITSTPSSENTLNVYPPPAGGTGEGGQILLAASGGLYTSASMLDTWQDQFRILRGSNTGGSNAGLVYVNLQTGNTQFVGAVTASAYSGLPNDYLYVKLNTNQTIPPPQTWANRDILFDNVVVNKGISYNAEAGTATLTGGKVYRITSRLAWSAAATYLLQYSCYDGANLQIGPTVEIIQSTNGTNNISDGTLDFIYAPVGNIDIKIRMTPATNALSGEYIRSDLNTQLIIQQIA